MEVLSDLNTVPHLPGPVRKKVAIVNVQLSPFRIPLFSRLRDELKLRNIDLDFFHGEIWPHQRDRNYECELEWANKISNHFFNIGGGRHVCWQKLPYKLLAQSDLVVITQENMIISNYPFIFRQRLSGKPLAFWGHGISPRTYSSTSLGERWRSIWTNKADWWFAYTQKSVDALKLVGFPEDRITNTNNTIDNTAFLHDAESVTDEMLADIRRQCNLDHKSVVGLYCGSLYADKRLDLLIEAADLIHQDNPEFRLVVIGTGAELALIEEAFRTRPWASTVGSKSGVEKAAYFKLANIILNPGLIGLIALDALCMGLPIVTTGGDTHHSPEVAMLEDNLTGFFPQPTPQAYAQTVIDLLADKERYARSREAAFKASRKYTLDNMVQRFADGIEACLNRPIYR
ncbi:MAG: glycosyltransferase family 4 protein [Burkholderiales bacterium]